MSRVFTRGGGRGGTGNGAGGSTNSGSSINNAAGNTRSRGSGAAPASFNQRDWKDQDLTTPKDSISPAVSTNVPLHSAASFSSNPPPQPSQQQQQQQPSRSNSSNQNQRNQQPSRQLYQPKPRGNSEKTRGSSSGNFANFDQSGGAVAPQNRDRDGPSRHKQGHSASRDHNRNKPRQAHLPLAPQQNAEQRTQRNFDQISSRETSSVETNENEETAAAVPSRNIMSSDVRENHQAPGFIKIATNVGPQSVHGQGPNAARRDPKTELLRGMEKHDRPRDDQAGQKPRMEQVRPSIDMYQNSFDSFGKSHEEETEPMGGFGRYKNGHVDSMLGPSTHDFDSMSMNMYVPPKSRYFPVGMGDMSHIDKLGDRSFNQSPHDAGDIFSKDVVWRGPEREETRNLFGRNEPSPPVIPKSLIWSNQSSASTLPHPQSESPHFGRPMGSGFPMDHSGFPSNLLNNPSPSMMDASHMDVGMHQRLMHNMPINQFLTSNAMPDRMHPAGMGDRMPPMFSQQTGMHQQLGQPVRFHPQTQFSESFIPTPLGREQNRMPQQGQLHMQQPGVFMPPNNLNMGAGNKIPTPRSPQTVAQDKNWTWEEQSDASTVELPATEPVEDFGEFNCPALRGPKNFDNLCTQAEELRKAIQDHLKEFVEKPHKERLRRLMLLCFTFWNVIRDAILLDNVQACDKTRELDLMVWREGFYPIFSLMRSLIDKNGGKVDSAALTECMKSLLGRGLKFYSELIPRVLHPFGGAVTPHILVNALTGKTAMADHIVISLQLAERLLLHMGDLYRYQAELPGADGTEISSAKDAYQKACLVEPYNGQPHNRLALVAKRQSQPLDAAFHFIRAVSARLPANEALAHLITLWSSVEKTYESKFGSEEKTPVWSAVQFSELWRRFQMVFLYIHGCLYQAKPNIAALTTHGTAFLGMLEAVLNHPLSRGLRDVLLQMTAINLYRLSVIQADGQAQLFLMDLSFNMFDLVLARLLKIFETAPDLDSAAHLEDTTILSPAVKVFVEWFRGSYQKWYPLAPSQLSSPQNTKRTGLWSRLISLVNLSLTLNVAGVAEERFVDSVAGYMYEDLFLAGMPHIYPTLGIFFRENKLHEAIAEPRFRFRKMQPIGMILLSVSPPVARLQWNRFLPTEGFEDKKVKTLWAPLEPPPAQRTEPLPTLERVRELPPQQQIINLPAERPQTGGWKQANHPAISNAEQNWPTIGQASKVQNEERRDRVRSGSSHSTSMDEGISRASRNGEHIEVSRSNVEPWWLIDQRLRSKDTSNQLKMGNVEPTERKPPRVEESSKQYFLVDTNCLIDYLDRIEKKMLENDELVVIVPGVVSRELWKLHEKKNIKAHAALSFISDAMEHSKGRLLILTTKGDHVQYAKHAKNEIVVERGSNDDIILRTCIALGEKGLYNEDDKDRRTEGGTLKGSLTLLTSDANMRVKARKENICCRLISEVLGQ